MMSVFFLIVLSVPALTVLWWWWADARLRRLPRLRWTRGLVAAGAAAFLACFAWFIAVRVAGVSWAPSAMLTAFTMLWGLIFLPMLAVPTMIVWTGWRAGAIVHRLIRPKPPTPAPPANPAPRLTRREALAAAVVTLPTIATLGTTLYSIPQRSRFRIRELDVRLASLPAALDGLTIAHVSDSHVGKFTRGPILDDIAAATNDLGADLVLFTGDLLDYSIKDLPEALRMIDKIDRRQGLFLIEGNHDLFDGREAFERGVRDAGVPILLDEAATVRLRGEAVQLLGLRWQGRSGNVVDHVDRVEALRDPAAFPILLAHHPHAFDRAAQLDIPLTLAGHTHGGQLMLSDGVGFGPWMFKYWSGLYAQPNAALVVSNGVGNWFPVRTHAPAELIRITLRRA